jgi:hypothetical protein
MFDMIQAILTEATCGITCWYAKEKICRCSCGGRNHGALLDPDRETPERVCKIHGDRYRLEAVGPWSQMHKIYLDIMATMPWAKIDPNITERDGVTPYHQPYFLNSFTKGSPLVLKKAVDRQYSWPELKMAGNQTLYLLWVNQSEIAEPIWCDDVGSCPRCLDKAVYVWGRE